MNFKSIFNFFVFGLTLIGSIFVAYLFIPMPSPQPVVVKNYACKTKKQAVFTQTNEGFAIYELLKQDISNGDTRTENYGDSDIPSKRKAKSVQNYVETSDNMKVSHLPKDFQIAWKKHMQAWKNYSEYLNKNVKKSVNFDKDFYIEREDELNDKINSTWEDVLDVSENYYSDIRLVID